MANDFSIAEFLAWCRTKPADEDYNYINSEECALAQFGRSTGRAELVGAGGTKLLSEWDELHEALNPIKTRPRVWGHTYGELVERLEALCPADPVAPSDWARIDAYLTDIETVEA